METRYHWVNVIKVVKLVFILFLLSISFASFVIPALANDQEPRGGESYQDYYDRVSAPVPGPNLKDAFDPSSGKPLDAAAVQGGGFNTDVTFEIIVSTVLTIVLGLMGAIFLVLAIYAGYNWMMAGGNEERVEKSKQTLTNAIIGIIVVLAAYAIVRIIVSVLGSVVFKTT